MTACVIHKWPWSLLTAAAFGWTAWSAALLVGMIAYILWFRYKPLRWFIGLLPLLALIWGLRL